MQEKDGASSQNSPHAPAWAKEHNYPNVLLEGNTSCNKFCSEIGSLAPSPREANDLHWFEIAPQTQLF
jgi:hypothetical protein